MALCRTCAAILNRTISSPSLPLTRASSAVTESPFCRYATRRNFVNKLHPHRNLAVQHDQFQQQLRDLHQHHPRQSSHPSERETSVINDNEISKTLSSRPKSFKELVEMQKHGARKKKSLWDAAAAEAEAEAEALMEEEKAAPEREPPSSGSLRHFDQMGRAVHQLYQSVRRQRRYFSRFNKEINLHFGEKINEELPQLKCNALKKEADLTKRLNESNLVMMATNKEMFFYGHPFRGAAMICGLWPYFVLGVFEHPAVLFAIPIYILGYWYLFLRKLVRAVWYDQDKDLFSIYIPFKSRLPMTFKPGHVTEIDDLLANLNILGRTKVFCPRGLFKSPHDYHKMFKYDKRKKKSCLANDPIEI